MSHLWLDPSPWLRGVLEASIVGRGAGMEVCRTWKAGGALVGAPTSDSPTPPFPSTWEGRNLPAAWI